MLCFLCRNVPPPKVLNFPKQHLYVLAPYTSFSFPGAWFNLPHSSLLLIREDTKRKQKQTNKQTNTFPNFYLAKRCMKCFVAHSLIHNYHIAWVVLMVPLQYMALDLMPCVPQGLNLGGETVMKRWEVISFFLGNSAIAKVRDLFFCWRNGEVKSS